MSENGTFYGFAIDFMEELCKEIKMNYNLQLVKDGRYGTRGQLGQWTGMVGELVRGVLLYLPGVLL